MNLPLVFEPEVQGEVDEAYSWYNRQREGLGEVFLVEAQAVLDRIQQNPSSERPSTGMSAAPRYVASPMSSTTGSNPAGLQLSRFTTPSVIRSDGNREASGTEPSIQIARSPAGEGLAMGWSIVTSD
jgi:hypothetical protein